MWIRSSTTTSSSFTRRTSSGWSTWSRSSSDPRRMAMSIDALRVVLVDINDEVVREWRNVFSGEPGAEVVLGSMLEQQVDAWVTPTNAQGQMDGGLDAVIAGHIKGIQKKVKKAIKDEFDGFLPVGAATCV